MSFSVYYNFYKACLNIKDPFSTMDSFLFILLLEILRNMSKKSCLVLYSVVYSK